MYGASCTANSPGQQMHYIYIYIYALGPTQPPVKWVPGLSRGKVRPGRAADNSPPSSTAIMEE